MAFNLLVLGILNSSFVTRAQESGGEQIPTPILNESHTYNLPPDNNSEIVHEEWGVWMQVGNVGYGISVRNTTQQNSPGPKVEYQQTADYQIGNILYIAMISIDQVVLLIGNQVITTNFTTCQNFNLTSSPIQYNGTIPGFNCNITINQIQVYPGTSLNSTFDLTLIHYVTINSNQTNIETQALFDLSNTKLYDSNGIEFNANEPFTAEIQYQMHLRVQGQWEQSYDRTLGAHRYNLGLQHHAG